MEEQRYWLSYDLGLKGNFDGLYEWLDLLEATECGEGLATFKSDESADAIVEGLRKVLLLELYSKSRIYLICKNEDGLISGKFVIGKRKRRAPWVGMKIEYDEDVVDVG